MIAEIVRSILYFITAAIFEISGIYGVWIWFREGKTFIFALMGFLSLLIYSIINTYQPAHFGRVYAAYGGVFVVMSILWGWKIDGISPDRFDIAGAGMIIFGVFTIMYARRIF